MLVMPPKEAPIRKTLFAPSCSSSVTAPARSLEKRPHLAAAIGDCDSPKCLWSNASTRKRAAPRTLA